MNTNHTHHIYPSGYWEKIEFHPLETGPLDDKSIGFLTFTDDVDDECNLHYMQSSTIVKFFSDFIEIEDVCREREHGNRASAETMENLRKIKKKLDKWFEPPKDEQ